MDKIIALIFSIILVLGLFAYSVLGQASGIKDTGDRAAIEQNKVNQIIENGNTVTGNTVKNYASQASSSLTVKVKNSADSGYTSYTAPTTSTSVKDNAIYSMSKTYDANGELSVITFDQISLAK